MHKAPLGEENHVDSNKGPRPIPKENSGIINMKFISLDHPDLSSLYDGKWRSLDEIHWQLFSRTTWSFQPNMGQSILGFCSNKGPYPFSRKIIAGYKNIIQLYLLYFSETLYTVRAYRKTHLIRAGIALTLQKIILVDSDFFEVLNMQSKVLRAKNYIIIRPLS